MSKLIKICDREYKIFKKAGGKEKQWPGSDVMPNRQHFNWLLIGPTNSGKTTLVRNILDIWAHKDTVLFAFVPTSDLDTGYQEIKQTLEKKHVENQFYTEYDGEILEDLLEKMKAIVEEEKRKLMKEGKNPDQAEKLDFIILFDDVPYTTLRDKTLEFFMRKARHHKCKVIISTQSPQITPTMFQQCYAISLFRGLSEYYLEIIKSRALININFDKLQELYENYVKEQGQFLTIIDGNEYRAGLFDKIEISEEDRARQHASRRARERPKSRRKKPEPKKKYIVEEDSSEESS